METPKYRGQRFSTKPYTEAFLLNRNTMELVPVYPSTYNEDDDREGYKVTITRDREARAFFYAIHYRIGGGSVCVGGGHAPTFDACREIARTYYDIEREADDKRCPASQAFYEMAKANAPEPEINFYDGTFYEDEE